jgi:hypothetical protein
MPTTHASDYEWMRVPGAGHRQESLLGDVEMSVEGAGDRWAWEAKSINGRRWGLSGSARSPEAAKRAAEASLVRASERGFISSEVLILVGASAGGVMANARLGPTVGGIHPSTIGAIGSFAFAFGAHQMGHSKVARHAVASGVGFGLATGITHLQRSQAGG